MSMATDRIRELDNKIDSALSTVKDIGIAIDTQPESYGAFLKRGSYIGENESYGGTINNRDRLYYSLREPVVKWFVRDVGTDIWDNWFKVKDIINKNKSELDNKIQPVLEALHSKESLIRLSIFERRYGTSILLLGYTNTDSFETPLFQPKMRDDMKWDYTPTDKSSKLIQMTPYPWTQVADVKVDSNVESLRYGLPEYYIINRNMTDQSIINNETTNQDNNKTLKVHWTRVIHDAPRLDEHPYEGIPVVDILFDDAVGYRNSKWGQYQTIFRYGSGFPHIKTTASKKDNEDWVSSGGPNKMMALGYFVSGPEEDITFKGAQGATLNPTPYNDMAFTNFSAATRIAQDTLKGVSAGRVTGSEVNERSYIKFITVEQNQTEYVLRELIDRLVATKQIEYDGEYYIDWLSAFETNKQDSAAIEFLDARTWDMRGGWMTINEIRAAQDPPLGPIPDGDVLVKAKPVFPDNLKKPESEVPNPESTEEPESTLFDEVKQVALKG